MNSKKLTLLFATAAFSVAPLIPLAAHAQTTVGLTGDAGTHVNLGATTTNSNGAENDATVTTDVGVNLGTILITREDADAATQSTTDASTTLYAESRNGDPSITSSTALKTHAKMVAQSDTKIVSLSLANDKVSMSYSEPATLFGVIKVHVPVTVTVDANGVTHVSYPWYNFILSTDEAGLSIRTQAAVNTTLAGTSDTTTDGKASLSLQTQARLIDSLHTAFKATANASTSAAIK